jgi:hypothetical protein
VARVVYNYDKKVVEVTCFISCGNMKPIENGTVEISVNDKFPDDLWNELTKTQQEEVNWFFLDMTE